MDCSSIRSQPTRPHLARYLSRLLVRLRFPSNPGPHPAQLVFGATDVALGTVIQNSRRLVLLALQAVVAKPVLGQPNASLPRGPIR
ncbi:hypothetical protein V6N11_061981 [Hibiscus sabdariffa]|uniref:Uncharacterized protein n=1 Tax=Hibiscus sabdariffa TaxID=183260 RepID=A0ABR2PR71_9ROSI